MYIYMYNNPYYNTLDKSHYLLHTIMLIKVPKFSWPKFLAEIWFPIWAVPALATLPSFPVNTVWANSFFFILIHSSSLPSSLPFSFHVSDYSFYLH